MALDPQTILNHLDSQREAIFQFCADLVRRPSPNPPGDTRSVADAVCTLLQAHDLPVEVVADQDHTSNLICSVEGLSPGRHFVLIGHMDTYPAGDETQWARPPFSGGLENGRLHGRGAGDMKSGLTALLFAYLSLASQRQFNGRLTLLAVSDEMNFSPHGARLLVARRPDLLGDAVVDAEPTSPDFVLFGEKGMLWIEVTYKGASGAAAFAPGLPNAIEEITEVLQEISRLREWQATMPPEGPRR
jgi:succinyl-diaminopimelate desuccinylase